MKVIIWRYLGCLKRLITREFSAQMHANSAVFHILSSNWRSCKCDACSYVNYFHCYRYGISWKSLLLLCMSFKNGFNVVVKAKKLTLAGYFMKLAVFLWDRRKQCMRLSRRLLKHSYPIETNLKCPKNHHFNMAI